MEASEELLGWRAASLQLTWMDEETRGLVLEHILHPGTGREAYVHAGSLQLSGKTGPDDEQSRADCLVRRSTYRLLVGTTCVGAFSSGLLAAH